MMNAHCNHPIDEDVDATVQTPAKALDAVIHHVRGIKNTIENFQMTFKTAADLDWRFQEVERIANEQAENAR